METLVYEKKLWYYVKNYTEKYGTLRRKNMVDYQKLGKYVYYEKNYSDIQKYVKFLNKFIHLEL